MVEKEENDNSMRRRRSLEEEVLEEEVLEEGIQRRGDHVPRRSSLTVRRRRPHIPEHGEDGRADVGSEVVTE